MANNNTTACFHILYSLFCCCVAGFLFVQQQKTVIITETIYHDHNKENKPRAVVVRPSNIANNVTTHTKIQKQQQQQQQHEFDRTVRPGVILWAHGRSATDTLAQMVVSNSDHFYSYCNGIKEGFKNKRVPLNYKSLRRCFKKGNFFTHIKPYHLTHARATDKSCRNKKSSKEQGVSNTPGDCVNLNDTDSFFPAASRAGFGTVLTSFRENVLAMMVSSYELGERNRKRRRQPSKMFDFKLSYIEQKRRVYDKGLEAAAREGFLVEELSFHEITTDTCGAVSQFFSLMADHSAVTRFERRKERTCKKFVSPHVKSSQGQRGKTLGQRVGVRTAREIERMLRGSGHEWMLDLQAINPTTQRGKVPNAKPVT